MVRRGAEAIAPALSPLEAGRVLSPSALFDFLSKMHESAASVSVFSSFLSTMSSAESIEAVGTCAETFHTANRNTDPHGSYAWE